MCREQIRVCTIYDYISLEESNPDDDDDSVNDSSFLFQREYRKTVWNLLKQLAPIRIYLVGNEARIENYWSRLLIPKELDNGRPNASKYTETCTFMEYEPVLDDIRKDVPRFLRSCRWQVTIIEPIRVDDIEKDKDFKSALVRVDDTLQQRENRANDILSESCMKYCENTSAYSDEVCKIIETSFFVYFIWYS